jgi:integrase
MTRTLIDQKLGSRTAREKLPARAKPYWRSIGDAHTHLGYRKNQTGRSRWVVRIYLGDGRYEVQRLPGAPDDIMDADGSAVLSFNQAVEAARALAARGASSAAPLTVAAACAAYIDFLKAERKTGRDAERRLAQHVLPAIGHKLVAELTSAEIEACKHAMVRQSDDAEEERRSKDSANRVLTSLRAALNRAYTDEANHIPSDQAWKRVKRFRGVGRARTAHLDHGQCLALIEAAEEPAFRNLIVAALLTGCRPPHELIALKVGNFSAMGSLEVDGKTGARTVTLSREAIAHFAEIGAERKPDELLLPSPSGAAWYRGEAGQMMQAAVQKAGLPPSVTLYTLRHTYASQSIIAGMNIKFLSENMGTSIAMLEKHYAKFFAAIRREQVEKHSFKLGLEKGKVLPFRRPG